MICPSCGIPFEAESTSCSRCGRLFPQRTRSYRALTTIAVILGLLALIVPAFSAFLGIVDLVSDFDTDPCRWSARRGVEAEALGLAFLYAFIFLLWLALSVPFAIPAMVLGAIALGKTHMRAGVKGGRKVAIFAIVCGLVACVPPHVQLIVPNDAGKAIARRLCEAYKRLYVKSSEGAFRTALDLESCERGAPSRIRSLLDHGAVKSPASDRLCKAIDGNAGVVAEWLIDHGADLNSPCSSAFEHQLPLALAVHEEMTDLVEHMLEHGADPNESGNGTSPLLLAVKRANSRVVSMLLSKGARVQECTPNERSMLTIAVERGDPRIVGMLLSRGARVDARCSTAWNNTALHVALDWNRRLSTSDSSTNPVAIGQISDRVAVVKQLLEHGADPLAQDDGGRTPLHIAARSGFIEGAERLLKHCDMLRCASTLMDLKDRRGQTALDLALELRRRDHDSPVDVASESLRRDRASVIADRDRMLAILKAWNHRLRRRTATVSFEEQ